MNCAAPMTWNDVLIVLALLAGLVFFALVLTAGMYWLLDGRKKRDDDAR